MTRPRPSSPGRQVRDPLRAGVRDPLRAGVRDPLRAVLLDVWHRSRLVHAGGTALAALLAFVAPANAQDACRDVEHKGERYQVCSFSPATHTVSLHLDGANGRPLGSLRALRRETGAFAMAMNAGMYRDDLSALGLYVEGGREHRPLIEADGWGNFHLLPNGVFHVSGNDVSGEEGAQRFGVTETGAFAANPPDGVEYATQSGPMLVIDGKLHPRFLPGSNSLKLRNGVGVSADGLVHFAISRGAVRFHDFGTLFRDVLQTPNALFLDGTISAFRAGDRRQGGWLPIGPMVAVRERSSD